VVGRQADTVHRVSPERVQGNDRRIRILPSAVADQIAAGEVVERPASVVKELVENALDAGARHITVEIEGAGSTLIAVVDDGDGMGPEDAVAAFSRHATSKVASAADLERISTLGFRGEALASIAAVSQTTLITRRREDLSAIQVEARHGEVLDVCSVGAPAGTRVEVADLFASVPARRKFLKAPSTETGHVSEFVTRTSVAWPQVGFVLRHGSRTLAEFAAVEEPAERIRQVFGSERARGMLSFLHRTPAGSVYGWITDSRLTFPSARQIYTYVNGRYIRDKLVSHAVVAGYSTLLMHGRYPGAVVFVEVPLDEVDVNVHPAKSEVRFRRGGAVHELISRGIQERLREQGQEGAESVSLPSGALRPAARLPMGLRPGQEGGLPRVTGRLRMIDQPAVGGTREGGGPVLETWVPQGHEPVSSSPDRESRAAPGQPNAQSVGGPFFSSLRVVGQIFDGYLVCEQESGLVLIDQHAAHERVMFEDLRTAYGKGAVPCQQLLIPVVVDVGAREAALVEERLSELETLGFEIDSFGGTSFSVRAVPALLGDCDPTVLLRDVAEELAEVGGSRRLAEAAEAVLARLACHSAVRVGQSLTLPQIHALLAAMDRVDFSGHCPHGRPAFIQFARSELERWFKRT